MPRHPPISRGARRALLRGGFLALGLAAAPCAAAEVCDAWPGEPTPLPTPADPDPARARWAELRADELVARASALEPARPAAAYRLWRHAACLAPTREVLVEAVLRTRPIRVHRPDVTRSGGGAAAADGDAFALLGQPLAVTGRGYVDEEARAAARQVLLAHVDARLGEAEERLRQARFREALATGDDVRGRLERMRRGRDLDAPRVRLELMSATAALALGDAARARACLARALAIEPELRLDPSRHPPKLLRALDAARAEAAP